MNSFHQQLFERFYFFCWNYLKWWPLAWFKKTLQPQSIRLAYFLWTFPSGVQTFVQREVSALKATGIPLELFAELGDDREKLEPKAQECIEQTNYLQPFDKQRLANYKQCFYRKSPFVYTNLKIFIVTKRYHQVKNLNQDKMVFEKAVYLAGVLKDHQITHVHSTWADINAFIIMVAAKLAGITYSFQGRAHDLHRNTSLHAMNEKFKHAKFIITNTQFNVNRIRVLSTRKICEKVHQIYNGIDLSRFKPGEKSNPERDHFHILAVGRLVEQKGFIYLLKALKLLKDQNIVFTCDIIGGPNNQHYLNYRLELMKLHRSLNLEEEVFFLGALSFDQILAKYQETDLFVLPCIKEKDGSQDIIPNVVIEAMAMKLPVISTTIGGIPEMIENGKSGILISPNDEEALAEKIEILVNDSKLRKMLGENARKIVEERFDIQKNIRQFVEVFNQN